MLMAVENINQLEFHAFCAMLIPIYAAGRMGLYGCRLLPCLRQDLKGVVQFYGEKATCVGAGILFD